MKRYSTWLSLERLEDRTVPSSPGDIDWVRQFGGMFLPPGEDPAWAVGADANGNVYVAGDLSHVLPGQTSAGWADAYVRKYDANGNELWTRQFGTSADDRINCVAVDATGVYVAGVAQGALPGQTSPAGNAFVRKYDADGNELWTRQFGGLINTETLGIALDSSGVYVVGQTSGTLPGQTSTGGTDAFVRKYDAAGNELWTRQFGALNTVVNYASLTRAYGIAVGPSGVYVVGINWDNLPGQTSSGSQDAFVRKYDAAGNELWTHQFGTGGGDGAFGVALDATGVYVTGWASAALPGQVSSGDTFVRKYDAAGNELWTHQFGNRGFAAHVAVDATGVYVAGYNEGALPGQTSAGGSDAFVRKYDTAGNEMWTRQFGAAGTDLALDVAVAASGVYVTGYTDGVFPGGGIGASFVRKYDAGGTAVWTRQFGPATDFFVNGARAVDADGNVYVVGDVIGFLADQTEAEQADAFVRKYDVAGNELWTREFGTTGFDQALAFAVDVSGVYVVGYTDGALPSQSSAGREDAFVRKYDANGNELWTRQFGTSGADSAWGVTADASGVYVTGSTTGAFAGQASAGEVDAFVRKYDSAGNALWTRQFGSAGADHVTGIAGDGSGIYLSGFTVGTFTGQASVGGQDAFVQKYDAAGNVLWTRQFGTTSADQASGIAIDGSGVYVAGRTAGTFPGQTSGGLTDAFVRRYDASGAEIWTRQFGTAGADEALGVADGSSGVYVTGSTEGALSGQANAGFEDGYVRKYDAAGNMLWTGQLGTAGMDSAAGVAVSAAGLFVAGFTTGAFPGQTAGGYQAFVAKIVDGVRNTAPSNLALTLNASIDENSTATVNGSFTDPDAADAHTVVIDWGTGEGTTTLNLEPGVLTFSAGHLFLDDNLSDIFPINVIVSDASAGTSQSTSLTVNNLAPAAGISGPSSGLSGDSLTFTLTATDASPIDQDAGFTFDIDWDGDGVVDETFTGPSGMTTAHNYATPGIYDVRVTAEDKDLGVSDAATAAIHVLARPTVQGLVWVDFNNDGEIDFGERAVPGVTITLTGIDDLGRSVNRAIQTEENGVYVFADLRPSNAAGYTIAETQPAGLLDGRDTLGTVNGVQVGSNAGNDVFSGIVISQGGLSAENYNFGERPATNGGVVAGQTATIGYWQNRNGQNLIQSLNGGTTATQLGHWLAATFPNMYSALDGQTNAEVAGFYKTLFARTSSSTPAGPPKTDAQVLATAFAVYVTNQTLAGTTAVDYGFQVTATGVGTRTFNVRANGAAFGVANNASLSVMDLLLAVNARSHNGLLYDQDGDGQISSFEASLRTMANAVFTGINEAGDI